MFSHLTTSPLAGLGPIAGELVNGALTLVVGFLALLIQRSIKVPRDAARAQLLAALANDAAAVVVNLNPDAKWAQKVRDVVQRITANSTSPTTNAVILERAAAAALVRLGHSEQK